jgi:uncharacterized membrane protein
MLPGIELRGAIPVGVALGMGSIEAFVVSYLGSLIPVIPIMVLLRPVLQVCSQINFTRPLGRWITERTRRKGRHVERYSLWGLFILVALPLPLTGVWTGSMVAAVLRLPGKAAFAVIAAGNLVAGGLITVLMDRVFM